MGAVRILQLLPVVVIAIVVGIGIVMMMASNLLPVLCLADRPVGGDTCQLRQELL